jgi:hypothetical protein
MNLSMNNNLYELSDIIFDGIRFKTSDGLYYSEKDRLGLWVWQKRTISSLKVPAYNHYTDDAFYTHQESVQKLKEFLISKRNG